MIVDLLVLVVLLPPIVCVFGTILTGILDHFLDGNLRFREYKCADVFEQIPAIILINLSVAVIAYLTDINVMLTVAIVDTLIMVP